MERERILREIYPEFKIKNIQYYKPVPPLDTAESEEIVEFVRSITKIQETGSVSYASEAGQFSNGGFQSVICGPGSIEQAHRANEYIDKEQLKLGVDMLQKLITKYS